MVKNTTGGNKSKGQARKLMTAPKFSKFLRESKEEGEIYAKVLKLLGNGMCHVLCIDNTTRLCFIRGKFRGRGKKDNLLVTDTLVLVGLREWDATFSTDLKNLQKCDLLEVYSDIDKERLKTTVHADWSVFQSEPLKKTAEGDFDFIDDKTGEYIEIMEKELKQNKETTKNTIIALNEEDIDFNDI